MHRHLFHLVVGSAILGAAVGCTLRTAPPGSGPGAGPAASGVPPSGLVFPDADTGRHLPEDRVYPQGRMFPFQGYSGRFEEDRARGFTVGGHHYGKQAGQYDRMMQANQAGLPYVYGIGLDGTFVAKDHPLTYDEAQLRTAVAEQVEEVAHLGADKICWWYIKPEEMRMWRKEEQDYLRIACETIRARDPLKRPIWMYDPNHRTADLLVQTGRHLDIIGKGAYVNSNGMQDDRVWIRWSMEQENEACARLQAADGKTRTPLIMPLLAADPRDPALDAMIPAWARHDTYLGLLCGARGVAIWSLFPRKEVKRTFQIHYDAYAACARELTGPLELGRVFLFGVPDPQLRITQILGPETVDLYAGPRNEHEQNTMSDAERKSKTLTYPALARQVYAYRGRLYLFAVNSTKETVAFALDRLPDGVTAEAILDTDAPQRLIPGADGRISVSLPAWGVAGIRISPGPAAAPRNPVP